MKNDNKNVTLTDPELPAFLKDARQNHGGMKVPEDFFQQFEQKMNAVIDADVLASEAGKKPQQPKAASFWPKRWVGIAAGVAIIVTLGIAYQFDWVGSHIDQPQPIDGIAQTEEPEVPAAQEESIELPEQVADELMADATDYDVFDQYYD